MGRSVLTLAVAAALAAVTPAVAPRAGTPPAWTLADVRDAWIAGESRDALLRATAMAEDGRDPARRASGLLAVAWWSAATGDRDRAVDVWSAVAPGDGGEGATRAAREALARHASCSGDPASAVRAWRLVEPRKRSLRPAADATALLDLGVALADQGDGAGAGDALESAMGLLERTEIDDVSLRAAVLDAWVPVLERAGETAEAVRRTRERDALGDVPPDPLLDPCAVRPIRASGPMPVYPAEARRERISATVVVGCDLDATGAPSRCEAIGGTARWRVLARAAEDALESWTWLPALDGDGRATAARLRVDVRFDIR